MNPRERESKYYLSSKRKAYASCNREEPCSQQEEGGPIRKAGFLVESQVFVSLLKIGTAILGLLALFPRSIGNRLPARIIPWVTGCFACFFFGLV